MTIPQWGTAHNPQISMQISSRERGESYELFSHIPLTPKAKLPTSTSGPRAIDALRTEVVVVDSFVFFTHKPTTDSELCSDCAAVNAAHGVGIPIKKGFLGEQLARAKLSEFHFPKSPCDCRA